MESGKQRENLAKTRILKFSHDQRITTLTGPADPLNLEGEMAVFQSHLWPAKASHCGVHRGEPFVFGYQRHYSLIYQAPDRPTPVAARDSGTVVD